MFRGYRYAVLAALGLLALIATTEAQSNDRPNGNDEAHAHQGVAAGSAVKPSSNSNKSANTATKCKDGNGKDMDCTMLATDAALRQAGDADLQADAAVAGGVIGFLTLLAAGAAAWFAKNAADWTKESAEAARDQVILSEGIANRQLRAYVSATNFRVEELVLGDRPRFQFDIKNLGQTPAVNLRIIAEVLYTGVVTDKKFRFRSRQTPNAGMTLHPGDSHSFTYLWPDTHVEPYATLLAQGAETFIYGGFLVYEDIFGKKHYTVFRRRLASSYLVSGKAGLVIDARGNRAN